MEMTQSLLLLTRRLLCGAFLSAEVYFICNSFIRNSSHQNYTLLIQFEHSQSPAGLPAHQTPSPCCCSAPCGGRGTDVPQELPHLCSCSQNLLNTAMAVCLPRVPRSLTPTSALTPTLHPHGTHVSWSLLPHLGTESWAGFFPPSHHGLQLRTQR